MNKHKNTVEYIVDQSSLIHFIEGKVRFNSI